MYKPLWQQYKNKDHQEKVVGELINQSNLIPRFSGCPCFITDGSPTFLIRDDNGAKKHRNINLTMLSHRFDWTYHSPEPNLLDSFAIIDYVFEKVKCFLCIFLVLFFLMFYSLGDRNGKTDEKN